jgi:hypothetical protein
MYDPTRGGLMLGGYEADPVQYDPTALPARFDIADLTLDPGVLRHLADSVREQLPIFQRVPVEIGVRVHRGGLPTMTADGEHTIGPVPGVRGCVACMWPGDVAWVDCPSHQPLAMRWQRGSSMARRRWIYRR